MRALAVVDPGGLPKHWAGGPFRHCFEASVADYRAQLEVVANRMSTITGIPRTEAGPCNVTWLIDPTMGTNQSAYSGLRGSDTTVTWAEIHFHSPDAFKYAAHESGHVMGLQHSPRVEDCMFDGPRPAPTDFSPDELAVLAWIYGR